MGLRHFCNPEVYLSHFFVFFSICACCGAPWLLGRLYIQWLVYNSSFYKCFEGHYNSPRPFCSLHFCAVVTQNLQRVHTHTEVSMSFSVFKQQIN